MNLENLSPKDIWQQLMLLRQMTKMTGVVHEAQILQLKMYWSGTCLSKKRLVGVDSDKKLIEFKNLDTKIKLQGKRMDFCTFCTRELLGPEWTIVYKVGNKIIKMDAGNSNG